MVVTQRSLLRDITRLTMPEVAASLGRDDAGRESGPAVEPFRVDAEYSAVPDKPGWGIELDREAMKRFGV